MSTPTQELTDRARKYIDDVVKINKEHGMGGALSEDEYNEAVSEAVDAFKELPHS